MNERKEEEGEKKGGGRQAVPVERGLHNILIIMIRVVSHLFSLLAFLNLMYITHKREAGNWDHIEKY